MARFYRITIGNVALTKTGLVSGLPAKLLVSGADALRQTRTGQTTLAADGTPYSQIVAFSAGKTLEIRVETYLLEAVWDSLVALINSALENGADITVVGTGEIGDFSVSAAPLLPKPFEAAAFENGRILKPVFRFVTV